MSDRVEQKPEEMFRSQVSIIENKSVQSKPLSQEYPMVTTQNMPTPSSLPTSKISENNAKDSIHNQGKQQQQQQQQQDQSNEQEKKHEKKQQEQQNPLQEMESMIDFSDLLNCFVRIERCQIDEERL